MNLSIFKHWVKKDVILSLDAAHLSSMRSLDIKRTVSSVANRFYLSWVLWWGWKSFILLELFYERVRTTLRLFWKTESFIIATNSWILRSSPLLSLGLLWFFSTLGFCLSVFIWNPLICSSFLEKWANFHLDVWNACCLPGVIVIKKIVPFHELAFIELLISKRKAT